MTLLLYRCESAILHATGLSALPPEVSTLELVSRAGAWLCAHPWKWLERLGSINTAASTNYVACPTDLRAVIDVQGPNYELQQTGLDEINTLRAQSASTAYPTLWALRDDLSAAGVFTKRLELYPTPSSIVALKVFYRAGWQEPLSGADSSRIAVPLDWEGLYLEALIAYAMGVEERDVAGVTARLDALKASEMFQSLVRQDGMSQSNYGPLRGGGVAMQMGNTYRVQVPTMSAPS